MTDEERPTSRRRLFARRRAKNLSVNVGTTMYGFLEISVNDFRHVQDMGEAERLVRSAITANPTGAIWWWEDDFPRYGLIYKECHGILYDGHLGKYSHGETIEGYFILENGEQEQFDFPCAIQLEDAIDYFIRLPNGPEVNGLTWK